MNARPHRILSVEGQCRTRPLTVPPGSHRIVTVSRWAVVRFRGAFCEPRHLCILLDFCAGGSLHNAIHKQRERARRTSEGFETSTLTLWLAQLASAVLYMHSHGVLHRDISTNNVFLDFYANLVIGDLGLAKRVAVCSADTNDALAVTTCGTPDFLSPELVQGQPYGAPSDAWAVGIVLFNLLSLSRPFWHTSILGLARQSAAARAPNSRPATRASHGRSIPRTCA